jgi:hypothetical protein
MDEEPTIIHFSGHGNEIGLGFENILGDTRLVTSKSLYRLLELYKNNITCIIFNACNSKDIACEISKLGIFSIGTNDSISDEIAIAFSIGFYQAIGGEKDIEFSFKLGLTHISAIDDSQADIVSLWKNGSVIQ